MTETGIIIAVIAALGTTLAALITVWRFRRKDRADAEQVEEGTISGRFKDADSLMRYIDERVEERVEERTAELAARLATAERKLAEHDEMTKHVRATTTAQWLWDYRGRSGPLPMLPDTVLTELGLGHLADPDFDNTDNPLMPPTGGSFT